MRPRSYAIGVDAGGSKTVAWVADSKAIGNTGEVISPIGRGVAGAGNLRAVGFEKASEAIAAAIDEAWREAGLGGSMRESGHQVKICLSAAGAGRESDKRQLTQWANGRFAPQKIRVTDDAIPILAAASADAVGVALICGTGSFAWGQNRLGEVQRCGGWGYLIGDEGSGYAIGIAALRAATLAVDGRGGSEVLLAAILERLKITASEQLIDKVYRSELERRDIAKLSELVFQAADYDSISKQMIESSAAELAALVNVLSERLGLECESQTTLALSGGLLIHQSKLRDAVLARVRTRFASIRVIAEPVEGAVRLAAQL